jgi:DNA-binding beta-propeller fold protein YncE
MKRISSFVAGLMLAGSALAQDSTGFANPESVISDGRYLYVTNLGKALDPTGKDGDGYISKLSLDGKMIERSFVDTKLNAPKGTAIIRGNAFYVADIDHVVGFNLANGKKIFDVNLAPLGTSFLNDLTVKDDFTLFVSATDIGKIIELNIRNGFNTVVADVKGANGIYYDKPNKRLYTCSFSFEDLKGGELGVISWNGNKPVYEKIGDTKGAFDGLALIGDSALVVSDWGALDHPAGFVQKIDLKTKKATKFDWPVIAGPADFYFDAAENRLVIPALVEGKLVIQKL